MVTYLTALRFAPNVEVELERLQRRIFSQTHDPSTRALPPLVPLHWSESAVAHDVLDDLRRRYSLLITGQREDTAGTGHPGIIPLPLGEDARRNLDALMHDLSVAAGETPAARGPVQPQALGAAERPAPKEGPGPARVVDHTPASRLTLRDRPRGSVVLSWSVGAAGPTTPTIHLPRTAALFLSQLEVIETEEEPWWNGITWHQRYLRRLANPGKERGQ